VATIGKCGIPDTLVHGDLHPGNVRRDGANITLLDWGDSFLGCPAFDILRLSEGASRDDAAALLGQWSALWKQQQYNSEPERAIALIRPLVPLLAAATYANFVEHIEESERPFHAFDVAEQLELAERILADGEHSDQA
jgi:Ser/Thr protein kinase RdoA (MazF antagonist)